MREVIVTSILQKFDLKIHFFEWCLWFKFNNLRLALGVALQFYFRVTKALKLKVRKFLGVSSNVCKSYREKTGRAGAFCPYSE